MAQDTSIEWADHTFNPWIGCTKVSPEGCRNCYAERDFDKRRHIAVWGPGQQRHRTGADNWDMPKRWERQAEAFKAAHGRRQRVFCASLADVFDNEIPEHWRWDLFRLIAATPHLDWLLLTKRIGNAQAMLNSAAAAVAGDYVDALEWDRAPWSNVWIGATVVNQAEAEREIRKLLAVPARVRFLSIEPMLGPVNLTQIPVGGGHGHHEFDPMITGNVLQRACASDPHVHWVIVGGESGPQARPMHPDWARNLRDQCQEAGVPFLFKQWGEWGPDFEGAMTCTGCGKLKANYVTTKPGTKGREEQCGYCGSELWDEAEKPLDSLRRVGKKAAGRLLDGIEHNGFPEGGAP